MYSNLALELANNVIKGPLRMGTRPNARNSHIETPPSRRLSYDENHSLDILGILLILYEANASRLRAHTMMQVQNVDSEPSQPLREKDPKGYGFRLQDPELMRLRGSSLCWSLASLSPHNTTLAHYSTP
ncbi:hypothetical protein Aduo_010331 [Ancylostoma duodenale]